MPRRRKPGTGGGLRLEGGSDGTEIRMRTRPKGPRPGGMVVVVPGQGIGCPGWEGFCSGKREGRTCGRLDDEVRRCRCRVCSRWLAPPLPWRPVSCAVRRVARFFFTIHQVSPPSHAVVVPSAASAKILTASAHRRCTVRWLTPAVRATAAVVAASRPPHARIAAAILVSEVSRRACATCSWPARCLALRSSTPRRDSLKQPRFGRAPCMRSGSKCSAT